MFKNKILHSLKNKAIDIKDDGIKEVVTLSKKQNDTNSDGINTSDQIERVTKQIFEKIKSEAADTPKMKKNSSRLSMLLTHAFPLQY